MFKSYTFSSATYTSLNYNGSLTWHLTAPCDMICQQIFRSIITSRYPNITTLEYVSNLLTCRCATSANHRHFSAMLGLKLKYVTRSNVYDRKNHFKIYMIQV